MKDTKIWRASAPANIALIKYMGKVDHALNLPTNVSLSYTLPHLKTWVELSCGLTQDHWQPLPIDDFALLALDDSAQKRYLDHLTLLKQHFDYTGFFTVRSGNNFADNAGLASSASSFAALTLCACQALAELTGQTLPTQDAMAQLSRLGSGSSCRSFFQPWAQWHDAIATDIDLPYQALIHRVILVSTSKKTISSSQAHRLVETSPAFIKRPIRAQQRTDTLLDALQKKDWRQAYLICWDEFQDMHHLFASATPSFEYMTTEVAQLLQHLEVFWEKHRDGPIITMDAGPNIHLLFRPDQTELLDQLADEPWLTKYRW